MSEKWEKIDRWIAVILGGGIGAIFTFFALVRPLGDWDEGLYSNIVSEIVRGGNWLHLMLQGVPWFDKEPLGFWLMAVSVKLFGWEVFALRVPALLATVAAVPIFYWLLRTRTQRSVAIITSLLFWTAPILWFKHTLGTADLEALTLLLGIAITAAYVRWPKLVWPALLVLSIFLMTRGVWALPFLGFLIIGEALNFWQTKNIRRLLNFSIGIIIAFLPWILWHVLQYQSNPADYVRIYWQEQFFTRISGEVDGHGGGLLFYWNFFKAQLSIGYAGLLVLVSAYIIFFTRRSRDLLWPIWLLITIIPPHVLGTKLTWYLVPALPAMFAALGICAQTIVDKKYLLTKTVGLVWVLLLGFGLIKTHQTYNFFVNTDKQVEVIVAVAEQFIPPGTSVVTYGVRNWSLGRVLPAFYWHATIVRNWNIISVDSKSAEYYLADPNQFQYWWVTTSTLSNLQKYESFSGCVLITTTDYIVLTTVTTSPHCQEKL